ncbi:LuxR C-terminal-related transcriptional regulator [Sphingomonas arvum]|nr:LuxR C-terminal-related transcriptional regulator [Sphingomonas sp. BN140010]
MAWELSLAEETVKAYLKNIFLKLGVSDRTMR